LATKAKPSNILAIRMKNNNIKIFTDGDQLYEAMIKAIQSATKSITMESYIFASDSVGWDFAKALSEKAKEAVDVRLLIDSAGSFFYFSREMRYFLKKNGVKIRFFHHWSWRRPFHYNQRNHRKLLIIDEKKAFLGGFNIHKQSSFKAYGEKHWRDTHISIEQPIILDAARTFENFWKSHLHIKFSWKKRRSVALAPGESKIYQRHMRYLYNRIWPNAKEYIYLTTPYFVPDIRTQRGIIAAAERGVDVRVLVPHKSDIRITKWAARAAYTPLLRAGVRIYEYLPRMLHAKTIVVDGKWTCVGTANMDYRSFFVNHEIVLLSRVEPLCAKIKEQFLDDLTHSEEICKLNWPLRSWREKMTETIGKIARRLL